ncbi:MAG: SEC-C domain-containing protein [Parachlamydiaceae bacterium]|nr:SEC-C domain-containing protein [Parachlamydiaceae bacterium]
MDQKIGRNDLCPCGSGKKYKQCCMLNIKPPATKRKLTAKWINAPQAEIPNLMERTFGNSISKADKTYTPPIISE